MNIESVDFGPSFQTALEGYIVLPGSQSLPECAGNLCALARLAVFDHLRILRTIVLKRNGPRRLHSHLVHAYVPAFRRAASALTVPGRVVVVSRNGTGPIRLRAAPEHLVQISVHGAGDRALIFRLGEEGCESILHVSTGAASAEVVCRQLRGMALARERIGADLSGLIAQGELLATVEGRLVSAQTVLPGHSARLEGISAGAFREFLDKALLPLDAIHARRRSVTATFVRPDVAASGGCTPIELMNVSSRIIAALERWLAARVPASVLVHGDYWLGNVLFDGAPLRVSGIVDWERCHEDGYPGLDALHLGLLSYAMWRKIPAAVLIADILSGSCKFDFCETFAAQVSQRFDLTRDDLKHIASLVWLSYVAAGFRDHHGFSNAWVAENVGQMEPALDAWLSEVKGYSSR